MNRGNRNTTARKADIQYIRNKKAVQIKKKKTSALYRGVFSVAAGILLIAVCCFFFNTFFVSAHGNQAEEPVSFTYYKSIVIQPGDTLWDIAEENMTSDCQSVEQYIDTLKTLNSLESDEIHAGESLMIAYNDTEFLP
ncbi:MAG: LysM peptidoglycan-binding domain-containing protein [Clostridiales bacterium]|nr:LysM peptidoglycan-binding domain-containing protein [Clostridiales bacterium]